MSNIINDSSAFVILINDDNSMTITQKRRITQRSKLVDDLWFLAPPFYNNYSMADFTVSLEYVLPVSRRYRTEILELSGTYNEYLKYLLPIDTDLTSEAGDIDLLITFLKAEVDDLGRSVQRVRKVSGVKIHIVPISAWSDIIPDDALSALDQRIIKTDAQIRALADLGNLLSVTKVDNLIYDDKEEALQLSSNGVAIGDKVFVRDILDEGFPVVDLNPNSDNGGGNTADKEIVEF